MPRRVNIRYYGINARNSLASSQHDYRKVNLCSIHRQLTRAKIQLIFFLLLKYPDMFDILFFSVFMMFSPCGESSFHVHIKVISCDPKPDRAAPREAKEKEPSTERRQERRSLSRHLELILCLQCCHFSQ